MAKDPLVSHVKEFLLERLLPEAPLLLALSGGGDSLALLYLLLECKKELSFSLHLAHVDHGWRSASVQEARELKELGARLGLPFHLLTLESEEPGNLEAKARDARYAFFQNLYSQLGCQALLLAHQADDQAETILKRVLEGSHFLALGGMQQASLLYGMNLWRPLLETKKKDLETWLAKRGLRGFQDPTNHDPAFLRARMRTQILPQLREQFGKEISSNLLRLGKTFERVKEMMESDVEEALKLVERDARGISLKIPESFPRLKRSALLKRFLQEEDFFLSYECFEAVLALLQKNVTRRTFVSKKRKLIVERGILFIRPLA